MTKDNAVIINNIKTKDTNDKERNVVKGENL